MGKILEPSEHALEKREKIFAEQAYLEYFNRYLYTHNVISEREYKQMVEKIAARNKVDARYKGFR